MAEALNPLDRAGEFERTHVLEPADFDAYCKETIGQWLADAREAHAKGEPIYPMWLRRNGDSGTIFGALVDYLIPTSEGDRHLAAIHVDGEGPEVEVWLPSPDGSGGPVVSSQAPYDLNSLAAAIELVEASVPPFTPPNPPEAQSE